MRLAQGLASGLFFAGFGALGLWLSAELNMGTIADMGPGWVPRALSIACIVIGVVLAAGHVFSGADDAPVTVATGPLVLVTAMVVGFAALLPVLGLPLTVVACTLPAAVSGEDYRWPALLAIAVALAALTTGLFAYALKLQIPVLPAMWS